MNDYQRQQNTRLLSCYKSEGEIELQKSEVLDLEKGGKAAFIGEIRSFGGRDYIKTHDGWKFHGKGTGEKAQAHVASSTHIETKKEPTFSEKYPGNTPEFKENMFTFRVGEAISTRRYHITNVTDKNVMYEQVGRYSSRSERMTIKEFTDRLDADRIMYNKLPKLEEATQKTATSESESYKSMILDLKRQTTDLKDAYIAKTKAYREGEFDRSINKYGKYIYEDWVAKFPGGRYGISKEGESLRKKISDMKFQGKDKYVRSYMKLAEMHYNSSLEKLGRKITEAGFDTTKVRLSSSSVGVNFSTEVTDGNKYMRAYTIIAEGPINAPHYRYLFTSNKQK